MNYPKITIVRGVPMPEARFSRRSAYREFLSQLKPPKNNVYDSIKVEDPTISEFSCPYEIAKELKMKISYKKLGEGVWQVFRIK